VNSFVAELVRKAGSPRAEEHDWSAVNSRLGVVIPEDFRELLDRGCGGVWYGHIAVSRPGDPIADRDLLDSRDQFEDLRYFWGRGEPPPVVPMPESVVLIAWASAGGGEGLYWWVDLDNLAPEYPVIVGTEDGHAWERYEMGAAEFLLRLGDQTIVSDILVPEILDLEGKAFTAYAESM
jgi:hypothetical protein